MNSAPPPQDEIHRIIHIGRRQILAAPHPCSWWAVWLLALLSALLLWSSFFPLNWGFLAWISLVPMLLVLRWKSIPRYAYWASYGCGLCFYVPALQWMRLGDPTMYLAWIALAVYLSLYFPLALYITGITRRHWGLPLAWVFAPVWILCDYAQAHLLTGFAWYDLATTQYLWSNLIQLADITGIYGISFLIAFHNAAIVEAIPDRFLQSVFSRRQDNMMDHSERPEQMAANRGATCVDQNCLTISTFHHDIISQQYASIIISMLLLSLTIYYGHFRRQQATFLPGPRVALIQGNFPASLRIPEEDYSRQYLTHLRLTARAVQEQPDLIIWPESMVRWPLFLAREDVPPNDYRRLAPRVPPQLWEDQSLPLALATEANRAHASMILGIECYLLTSKGIRHYNSALLVQPEQGITQRYDKIHLVPFGEYLPLKDWLPWLYRLTPFPDDYGLHPGNHTVIFSDQQRSYLPAICYEDTVPHLLQQAYKRHIPHHVDMIVNLTNDGWFRGSSEQEQHLVTALFRAIELRAPMVRAVNSGISAVIDGNGSVLTPEFFFDADQSPQRSFSTSTGRWQKNLNAALVSTVPLDPRDSLYAIWGDWFPQVCSVVVCLWLIGSLYLISKSLRTA